MVGKTSKTGLGERLGLKGKKAVEAHKGDQTEVKSGGNLPAGIEFGVAQLVEFKFGKYKEDAGPDLKGKDFVYMAGVVVRPKYMTVDGTKVKIEGLRTNQTEPLCDTPERTRKDLEAHVAWLLNQMRLLGVDTAADDFDIDVIESYAETLKEEAPHFSFRTWKGTKQTTGKYKDQEPRVQHDWGEKCEPPEDDEENDGVVDATGDAPEPATGKKAAVKGKGKAKEAEPEELDWSTVGEAADAGDEDSIELINKKAAELEIDPKAVKKAKNWAAVADMITGGDEDNADEADLDTLGSQADEGDEESKASLTEKAGEAGLDPDEYPTWAELATALAETGEGTTEDETEAEEDETEGVDYDTLGSSADEGDEEATTQLTEMAETNGLDPNKYPTWADLATELQGMANTEEAEIPAKGSLYHYTPPGKKVSVECAVFMVFEKEEKVNLKNLANEKIKYLKVPFDELKTE